MIFLIYTSLTIRGFCPDPAWIAIVMDSLTDSASVFHPPHYVKSPSFD